MEVLEAGIALAHASLQKNLDALEAAVAQVRGHAQVSKLRSEDVPLEQCRPLCIGRSALALAVAQP